MNIPEPTYSCTPFSDLDEHNWSIVRHLWGRGIDWSIRKVGRKWMIGETYGKCWPLYKTKSAAYDALSNMICAESQLRSYKRLMAAK